MVFAWRAENPVAVLPPPVVFLPSTPIPNAVLNDPVVLRARAEVPVAVLLKPTVFCESTPEPLAVLSPPVVLLPRAPWPVANVYVNDQEYGYSNGAYYDVQASAEEGGDPTFEVVAPPVGASVNSLPDGSSSETVDGTAYFVYADTYYKPFYSGSDVVYMVAEKPQT